MIMARTIVSTSQLCLSRQQQEFLAKYRTASAMQAYLDSYGEGENNFLDSTSAGGSSKPVTPDSPLPYDFEVQYLEVNADSGLAYIDTNIIPNGDGYELETSFDVLGYSIDGYLYLYGTNQNVNLSSIFAVRNPPSADRLMFGVGNYTYSNFSFSIGDTNNVHAYDGGRIVLNGSEYPMWPRQGNANTDNLKLFSFIRGSVVYMRLRNFTLWYNGNVILDMIPVSVDGVGYMYDKVTKELFGAQGGGSFVVGPIKA